MQADAPNPKPALPASASHHAPSALVMLIVVSLAAAIAAGGAWFAWSRLHAGNAAARTLAAGLPDATVAGLTLRPFSMTDQSGVPVTDAILEDRVTIVNFVFTHCPLICPTMTAVMRDLSERLADTPVRFVSISVDPERDTPEVLRAFAERSGADLSRWSFLTGDKAQVEWIVTQGMKFHLAQDPSLMIPLGDGASMANIVHPGHFVLVGPTGEVLSIYRHADADQVDALEARARAVSRLRPESTHVAGR